MCLLPCVGVGAWGSYKVNRTLDRAFTSSEPQEPTESVIVSEAKLALKLASFKPSSSGASTSAPQPQGPPARGTTSRKVSKKEEASKARLQALIDQHAPSKKRK